MMIFTFFKGDFEINEVFWYDIYGMLQPSRLESLHAQKVLVMLEFYIGVKQIRKIGCGF